MSPANQEPAAQPMSMWMRALLPLMLLAILLGIFLKFGPLGVFSSAIVPLENAFIQKIWLTTDHFSVEVFNDGQEPITIAQVLVNDAYWQFSMSPSATLQPLEHGTIEIDYPWLAGDPQVIKLMSRNGIVFEKEIEAAVETPTFNWHFAKAFILLGIYVGVIPVLLGLLWLPFLRMLRQKWYSFLLALTVGLLIFLGFDAVAESFELLEQLPEAYNGIGIFVIGFSLAILALSAVSYRLDHHKNGGEEQTKALAFGYLIALGIGLHNMGEGLAIGSAYSLGEVALGGLLVIGFMVHNVTEGVAIVAPLTRLSQAVKNFKLHLVLMGLLAGAPTILGTLIGGFTHSAAFSILFLSIGAGAIFDVSFDIMNHMAKGRWISIFTMTNVVGFVVGLLIMYATGFLVLG
jgi:zinc transporter, ZIP family